MMKLSMWLIGRELQKYHPDLQISDGSPRITGFQILADTDQPILEPQTLYLLVRDSTALLLNVQDRILLHSADLIGIVNDLLSVFAFYNEWETALQTACTRHSIQEIIDLGTSLLNNPLVLSDNQGNVLAMSTSFLGQDVNRFWDEVQSTSRLPAEVLGAPLRTQAGILGEWTEVPQILQIPGGGRIIGTSLFENGEIVANLGLVQHKTPISECDIHFMTLLRNALLSVIKTAPPSAAILSGATVISDLLAGGQIDTRLLGNLDLGCSPPWRFVVITNPFRNNPVYRNTLVSRLQAGPLFCIPFIFNDYIVTLVAEQDASNLLNAIFTSRDMQYYQVGISLPFDDLNSIPGQYKLTLFSIGRSDSKPGVYRAENYAMSYILEEISKNTDCSGYIHPALSQLMKIDRAKNSQLYETLFQYLIHERSLQLGAEAMHVHRNSFMYRIQRIREMTNLDLDDVSVRQYLLLCYMLDKKGNL